MSKSLRRRSTLSHSATAEQLTTLHARPTLLKASSGVKKASLKKSGTLALPSSPLAKSTTVTGGSLDSKTSRSSPTTPRDGGSECIVHSLLEKRMVDKLANLAKQRRVDLASLQTAATRRSADQFINALVAPLATRRATLMHELVRYCSGDVVLWLQQYYPKLFCWREPDSAMLPTHAIACVRSDNDSEEMLRFWRNVPLELLSKVDGERVTADQYLAFKRTDGAARLVRARIEGVSAVPSSGDVLLERAKSDLRKERDENRRLAHNSEAAERGAEELRYMHRELNEAIESRTRLMLERATETLDLTLSITGSETTVSPSLDYSLNVLGVIRFQHRLPDFLHVNSLLRAAGGTDPAPPAQICFDNGRWWRHAFFLLRLGDGAKGATALTASAAITWFRR